MRSRLIIWCVFLFATGVAYTVFFKEKASLADELEVKKVNNVDYSKKMELLSFGNKQSKRRISKFNLEFVKISEIPQENERRQKELALVQRWIAKIGVEGLLELIDHNYNNQVKKKQDLMVQVLLAAPKVDQDFFNILQTEKYKEISDRWASSIESPFGAFPAPDISVDSLAGIHLHSIGAEKLVGIALGSLLSRVAKNSEDPSEISASLERFEISPFVMETCLVQFSHLDPKNAWLVAGEILPSPESNSRDDTLHTLTNNLISLGFDKAVPLIIGNFKKMGLGPVGQVFQRWIEYDVEGPAKWLENKKATLHPEVRDRVSIEFSSKAITEMEFETARLWSESLLNVSLKSEIDNEIYSAEREVVLDLVESAPLDSLNKIIFENNTRPDALIKDAFELWLERDFESANSWFLDNQEKIPAQKMQHVARVYIENSLQDDDLEKAYQWKAYIADPSILVGVEKEIAEYVANESGE